MSLLRSAAGLLRELLDRRRPRAEGYPGRGVRNRPPPLRRAVVDPDACLGCGTCSSVCYYRRIGLSRGTARVLRGCRGCGACARECPRGAVAMVDV